MNNFYVPLLRCKKGEQIALLRLSESVKNGIKPLLELPYSNSSTKQPLPSLINSFWNGYPYFIQFSPEWYDNISENISDFLEESLPVLLNNTKATPVINLSDIGFISNWKLLSNTGFACRIRNNEFSNITDFLTSLFSSSTIKRNQVDLILDLQHISSEYLFDKMCLLRTVCSEIESINEYRSVIIASTSFPDSVESLEREQVYHFERQEKHIHELALKLATEYDFNYMFADYGTSGIDDSIYVPGMSPNFKIKYTTASDYIYIKGYQTKKGGLDIQNVRKCANTLINCNSFSNQYFSWGDGTIYNIAIGHSISPGNLTNWISYSLNHHITLLQDLL